MHSPFPGMDPYLENPGLWPDVHHGLISEIQASLNRQLRPRYHVRIEERVYISDENDAGRKVIIPDLKIVDHDPTVHASNLVTPASVSVAEPILLTTLIDDEIHEPRLEIIDIQSQTVVTVIELLNPTNKIAGSRGRASYEQKRREIMTSSSHFVEIDLLRGGDHLHTRELLPPADYTVHVSRKDTRPRGYVWPILLPQRLPVINIPLSDDDKDASLDLQAVLSSAYERAAYDLIIDYRSQPEPPLVGANAKWATDLLVDKGLVKG